MKIANALDLDAYRAVVCVGGDGTLAEVFNGLMTRPDAARAQSFPVGVVPAGSGNAVAKSLTHRVAQPCDNCTAALAIARGHLVSLDRAEFRAEETEDIEVKEDGATKVDASPGSPRHQARSERLPGGSRSMSTTSCSPRRVGAGRFRSTLGRCPLDASSARQRRSGGSSPICSTTRHVTARRGSRSACRPTRTPCASGSTTTDQVCRPRIEPASSNVSLASMTPALVIEAVPDSVSRWSRSRFARWAGRSCWRMHRSVGPASRCVGRRPPRPFQPTAIRGSVLFT